jgi:hypothetical protein
MGLQVYSQYRTEFKPVFGHGRYTIFVAKHTVCVALSPPLPHAGFSARQGSPLVTVSATSCGRGLQMSQLYILESWRDARYGAYNTPCAGLSHGQALTRIRGVNDDSMVEIVAIGGE